MFRSLTRIWQKEATTNWRAFVFTIFWFVLGQVAMYNLAVWSYEDL